MKTVAELVQMFAVNADGWHFETDEDAKRHDDALEKVIEQVQRETVEALLVALEGYYCAPVDAELEAYLRDALSPKGGPT